MLLIVLAYETRPCLNCSRSLQSHVILIFLSSGYIRTFWYYDEAKNIYVSGKILFQLIWIETKFAKQKGNSFIQAIIWCNKNETQSNILRLTARKNVTFFSLLRNVAIVLLPWRAVKKLVINCFVVNL